MQDIQDSKPLVSAIRTFIKLICLLLIFLVLLIGIISLVGTSTPPEDPCKKFESNKTVFSNWRTLDYTFENSDTAFERQFYATVNGTDSYIGTVTIYNTTVPAEAQTLLEQLTMLNPNVYVHPNFTGQGIGEYLLRETISLYPKGTKFLWIQDPNAASGNYTWNCFKKDFQFNTVRVPKSNNFSNETLTWFINQ